MEVIVLPLQGKGSGAEFGHGALPHAKLYCAVGTLGQGVFCGLAEGIAMKAQNNSARGNAPGGRRNNRRLP